MKKFRGGSSVPERRRSLSEVAGSNPAPRSLRQALAAGLHIDPASHKLGFEDGLAAIFRLTGDDILGRGDDIDALAYAGGWLEGYQTRKRRS